MQRILLLHPGQMGTSIGASLMSKGIEVNWIRGGRSEATASRASENGFLPCDDLGEAVRRSDAVFSICPPEFALSQAQEIHRIGFDGIFVDGNAVSPDTSIQISHLFGDRFVDGGIVGPPAWNAGTTRFFLSGKAADQVAALFANTAVEAKVVPGGPGKASAVKMAYAAYTKGGGALLLAVAALAERHGVSDVLFEEWDRSQPGLSHRAEDTAKGMSGKAWRFVGEMREIEKTLDGAGLPPGFCAAAAELYEGLADFRDDPQNLKTVMAKLLKSG